MLDWQLASKCIHLQMGKCFSSCFVEIKTRPTLHCYLILSWSARLGWDTFPIWWVDGGWNGCVGRSKLKLSPAQAEAWIEVRAELSNMKICKSWVDFFCRVVPPISIFWRQQYEKVNSMIKLAKAKLIVWYAYWTFVQSFACYFKLRPRSF